MILPRSERKCWFGFEEPSRSSGTSQTMNDANRGSLSLVSPLTDKRVHHVIKILRNVSAMYNVEADSVKEVDLNGFC